MSSTPDPQTSNRNTPIQIVLGVLFLLSILPAIGHFGIAVSMVAGGLLQGYETHARQVHRGLTALILGVPYVASCSLAHKGKYGISLVLMLVSLPIMCGLVFYASQQ